jgi:hypothetical protein
MAERGFEKYWATVQYEIITGIALSRMSSNLRAARRDGGQRNLGLTDDSSQFVGYRIECTQRV